MNEIALIGPISDVQADILGALLECDFCVNVMVAEPQKVMLNDSRLRISAINITKHNAVRAALRGYDALVLAYKDDLTDVEANDTTRRYYASTLRAAHEAGIKRIIVVGSPMSEAFFVSTLRRLRDIDGTFISTRGNFPHRTANALI